jgi:Family of unknown function (DUF6069)
MSHLTYLQNAILGLIGACIGVALVALLADAVSPALYAGAFGGDPEHITLSLSVWATVFNCVPALLVGYLAFWRRWSTTTWYAISLVVLVLSGLNSFVGATTIETALWLNLMHFVAAAAIVPAVASLLPVRSNAAEVNSVDGNCVPAAAS